MSGDESGDSAPRGAGGGGGQPPHKKQRRNSAADSWKKILALGWCRTSDADKARWLGDAGSRSVWCVSCSKTVLYGGTFSNIISHQNNSTHKSAVASQQAARQQHPHVLAMMQSPVGVGATSEEARMNARGIFALRALTLAPKGNLAELFGGNMLTLATKLAQTGPVLTAGGTTDRAISHGYGLLREEIKRQLSGKVVSLHFDEANSKLKDRHKPMVLVLNSSLLPKPVMVTLFWSLCEDALDEEEGAGGAPGHPLLAGGRALLAGMVQRFSRGWYSGRSSSLPAGSLPTYRYNVTLKMIFPLPFRWKPNVRLTYVRNGLLSFQRATLN